MVFEIGADFEEGKEVYGKFEPITEHRVNGKDERGKNKYQNATVCTLKPQKVYTTATGRGQIILSSFVDYVYADYNTGEPKSAIRYRFEIFDLDARGFPMTKDGKGKSTMHPVLFEKYLQQVKEAEVVYRKQIKPWMVEQGILPNPQETLGKGDKDGGDPSPSSAQQKNKENKRKLVL